MRRKIILVCFLISCLFIGGITYYQVTHKQDHNHYLKTVIYKDKDDLLIPVSLDFHNQMDIEEEVVNRIDMMKSDDYVKLGLYPIFSNELSVNQVDLNNKILTIDFNDELYTNDSLSIIEALTFTLCDYDEVDSLNILINGKEMTHLPNSNLVASHLTKSLGLNNFEKTTNHIHHTYPVMIYEIKNINNIDYFVPITTRINEQQSLLNQVNTILNYIDTSIKCHSAVLKDNILTLKLDKSLLLDDGTIDSHLLNRMTLSFESIDQIKDVKFIINNEEINNNVSLSQFNYIK